MTEYSALAARIREYLKDIDRVLDRADKFGKNVAQTGNEVYSTNIAQRNNWEKLQ
jgi:hypothetical protein